MEKISEKFKIFTKISGFLRKLMGKIRIIIDIGYTCRFWIDPKLRKMEIFGFSRKAGKPFFQSLIFLDLKQFLRFLINFSTRK